MDTPVQGRPVRKETGIRLPMDQIEKLNLLVKLTQGRRKRSSFICEAIDEFLAARLSKLTTV